MTRKTESYNACNLFSCNSCCFSCHLVFASNNLASLNLVLRGNASRASKNLIQNPCHLCPPHLPTMWYFLPFQIILHVLPLNYSKAIISYLCQCFIAHEKVMWCFIYQPCHLFMTDFHRWTSGIYIRLSNNFAKRASKWGAQSRTNYNFNH